MRRTFVASLLGVLCAVLGTSNVQADGLIRDGIGAISLGRGGTNLGFSDNAAIIYDNPAGMSNVACGGLFEVGIDSLVCDMTYTDPQNNVDSEKQVFPAGMVGFVHRAPDSPWTFGLGVFGPAGFGAKYDLVNNVFGQTRYESLGILGKVLPGVSYQVTDRLSIGATLGLAVCHVELEGPLNRQSDPFLGAPAIVDLQHTDVAPAGGVGLQYRLTPCTTVGLSYIEETRFDFHNRGQVNFGFAQSDFDVNTKLAWPRSLGLGVKHDLCCCRRVAVDVIWYDWSSAFDQLELTFSNPSNPLVGAVLGPELRDALPMNWKDSVSVRLGIEQDLCQCRTVRAGYVWHDSPVPNATVNPYLDGILEHAVSVGASQWHQGLQWNLAYQYSFGPTRHVETSGLAGGDFDDSSLRVAAHWFGLSVVVPR